MKMTIFVLDKFESTDDNLRRRWAKAVERIDNILTSEVRGNICPEAVLLIRDTSGYPDLIKAITVAVEIGLPYHVYYVEEASELPPPPKQALK